MKKHVTGQPVLGELRQHVLSPLIGNPLFSEAEHLRANHFVHETDDIARLTRWGTNVLAEIARRQAEAARQRRDLATGTTLHQLRSTSFRSHRARLRQAAPTWVPGTFFPDSQHDELPPRPQAAAPRSKAGQASTASTRRVGAHRTDRRHAPCAYPAGDHYPRFHHRCPFYGYTAGGAARASSSPTDRSSAPAA
nr:hypothetical protein [Tanacetum cinerariifolium]